MILRRAFPALIASAAALAGCKKAEVQSYRVPKEPVAATAPADHAHAHAKAPSGGATAPAQSGAAATSPQGSSAGSSMANTPVATATGGDLTWKAPEHWKTKQGSAMRKGTYVATGDGGEAELAITAFPGNVGGDLANLNRWRGQIKLPPVSEAEFESNVQRLERNGLKMVVVDIVGTGPSGKPERMLGAMVPHGGATWFFKMQGPDALVAKEKAAFMSLLDTVKPGAK